MIKYYSAMWLIPVLFNSALVLPAKAQCVPDTNAAGLYSPTEQEGLPTGLISTQYEAVITLKVPLDTTYMSFSAEIDSMVVDHVSGLPPGFGYDCSSASCGFPGGTLGCIRIFGITHDNAHAGTWDIVADFTLYLQQPPVSLPYTLTAYSITLETYGLSNEPLPGRAPIFGLEHNPVAEKAVLLFDLPENGNYQLGIYTVQGQGVYRSVSSGTRGIQRVSLPCATLPPGIYVVALKQGSYSRALRFVIGG